MNSLIRPIVFSLAACGAVAVSVIAWNGTTSAQAVTGPAQSAASIAAPFTAIELGTFMGPPFPDPGEFFGPAFPDPVEFMGPPYPETEADIADQMLPPAIWLSPIKPSEGC